MADVETVATELSLANELSLKYDERELVAMARHRAHRDYASKVGVVAMGGAFATIVFGVVFSVIGQSFLPFATVLIAAAAFAYLVHHSENALRCIDNSAPYLPRQDILRTALLIKRENAKDAAALPANAAAVIQPPVLQAPTLVASTVPLLPALAEDAGDPLLQPLNDVRY